MYVTTTFDELRDTLMGWLQEVSGRVVVLANTYAGPKPAGHYAVGLITVANTPSFQTATLSEDGLTETVRAITTIDFQVDFYGGDAMQAASTLVRSLKSEKRWLDLFKVCGGQTVLDMRDLSFLESANFKQRAQLTLRFSCNLADEFDSDFADSLPIELLDQDGIIEEDIPGGENPLQKAPVCDL